MTILTVSRCSQTVGAGAGSVGLAKGACSPPVSWNRDIEKEKSPVGRSRKSTTRKLESDDPDNLVPPPRDSPLFLMSAPKGSPDLGWG